MFKFVKCISGMALIGTINYFAQNVALAGGGFSTSCSQVNLNHSSDGWELDATCRAKNQSLVNNHLPLNPHIANDDGNLVWRKNGGFSASAYRCNLGGANLTCYTFRRDGSYTLGSINLDDEIANYDGHLTVLDGF